MSERELRYRCCKCGFDCKKSNIMKLGRYGKYAPICIQCGAAWIPHPRIKGVRVSALVLYSKKGKHT
jgi:hypothetical protein